MVEARSSIALLAHGQVQSPRLTRHPVPLDSQVPQRRLPQAIAASSSRAALAYVAVMEARAISKAVTPLRSTMTTATRAECLKVEPRDTYCRVDPGPLAPAHLAAAAHAGQGQPRWPKLVLIAPSSLASLPPQRTTRLQLVSSAVSLLRCKMHALMLAAL